jgi:flagellar protein FlaG
MAAQREVIQAVKAVNATQLLGQDNELTYQRDQETQRMVVKLVNRQTGDVVSQIPAEYVLRIAEDLQGKR